MTKAAKNFIPKSTVIHKNKYDYSLTNYTGNKTVVKIICPIHGEFLQQPKYHLEGAGCTKCGYESIGRKNRIVNSFISKSSLKDSLYEDKGANNKYTRVRYSARKTHKQITQEPCQICGYEKHVEICHIKPISSFSEETLLEKINAKDNIIGLCPNCHWELDHNLLTI